jgi:tetratricopeptide (TPR) repeat protein
MNLVTLKCRACLGSVLCRLNKYKESLDLLFDALDGAHKHLPANHPFAFTATYDVSRVFEAMGQRAAAKDLALLAFSAQRRILNPLLRTEGHLIHILAMEYDCSRLAVELVEEAEKYLGSNHVETAFLKLGWIEYLRQEGRFSEGEKVFQECLERLMALLGIDHPDTQLAITRSARTLGVLGQHEGLIVLLQKLYDVNLREKGIDNPFTLNLLSVIARQLTSIGRSAQAIDMLGIAHKRWQTHMASLDGCFDVDFIDCMVEMVSVLKEEKRYEDAEELYWDVLNCSRKSVGPRSRRSLRIMSLMAQLFNGASKTAETVTILHCTIEMRSMSLGSGHPDNYADLWLLGKCERIARDFPTAIKHLDQAFEFYVKTRGGQRRITQACKKDLEEAKKTQQEEATKSPTTTYHRPLNTVGMHDLVLQISASFGETLIPRTWEGDGRGPPAAGPLLRISEREKGKRQHVICEECQNISLESLLKARVSTVRGADGNTTLFIPDDRCPIKRNFDNPARSSQDCYMCFLILGHLSQSKERIALELYSHGKESQDSAFGLIDVAEEGNQNGTYQDRLLALAEPGSDPEAGSRLVAFLC